MQTNEELFEIVIDCMGQNRDAKDRLLAYYRKFKEYGI